MTDRKLTLTVMPQRLAVCRLAVDEGIPEWALSGDLWSITKAPGELSIICSENAVAPGTRSERGWRCVRVEGPLDFGECGILAG